LHQVKDKGVVVIDDENLGGHRSIVSHGVSFAYA
jgi:hypothetical protein